MFISIQILTLIKAVLELWPNHPEKHPVSSDLGQAQSVPEKKTIREYQVVYALKSKDQGFRSKSCHGLTFFFFLVLVCEFKQ